jgi:hypothetical protein
MTCGTLQTDRPLQPTWAKLPSHPRPAPMYAWGFGWAAEEEGRRPARRRRPASRRRPSRSRR